MILAILGCTACLLLVFVSTVVLSARWLGKKEQSIRDELSEFLAAPDPTTPSPLAVAMDQFALLCAARLMQQLKATLAGAESGESKQATASTLASLSSASPLVQVLAGIIPKKLRNSLIRNPQMVGALQKLVMGKNTHGDGYQAPLVGDD